MQYFNKATGQRVTVDEATFDGSRVRDGYRAMLEEGESIRFSINMLDTRPSSSSVFLTDQATDAQIGLEVAQMRASHTRKFSFMGDRAPLFDDAKARLVAAGKVQNHNAQVADAARFASMSDDPAGTAAARQRAYGKATAYKGDRDMRDHARSNRY